LSEGCFLADARLGMNPEKWVYTDSMRARLSYKILLIEQIDGGSNGYAHNRSALKKLKWRKL